MMYKSYQSCKISSGSLEDLPHLVSLQKNSAKTLEEILEVLKVLEEILGSFAASYKKVRLVSFVRLACFLLNLVRHRKISAIG